MAHLEEESGMCCVLTLRWPVEADISGNYSVLFVKQISPSLVRRNHQRTHRILLIHLSPLRHPLQNPRTSRRNAHRFCLAPHPNAPSLHSPSAFLTTLLSRIRIPSLTVRYILSAA